VFKAGPNHLLGHVNVIRRRQSRHRLDVAFSAFLFCVTGKTGTHFFFIRQLSASLFLFDTTPAFYPRPKTSHLGKDSRLSFTSDLVATS